jgi:uncharacterized membrane protein YkvA (DUF1232 family)
VNGLLARVRRVMALLADPRVPKLPRLAVALAAIYFLSPIDFVPDFAIPLGGFLDDAALLWMTLRWLINSGNSAVAHVEPPPVPPPPPQLPR